MTPLPPPVPSWRPSADDPPAGPHGTDRVALDFSLREFAAGRPERAHGEGLGTRNVLAPPPTLPAALDLRALADPSQGPSPGPRPSPAASSARGSTRGHGMTIPTPRHCLTTYLLKRYPRALGTLLAVAVLINASASAAGEAGGVSGFLAWQTADLHLESKSIAGKNYAVYRSSLLHFPPHRGNPSLRRRESPVFRPRSQGPPGARYRSRSATICLSSTRW